MRKQAGVLTDLQVQRAFSFAERKPSGKEGLEIPAAGVSF